MKLYFSPGACSLSIHIALREAGIDFEGINVNLQTHKLANGEDYYAISPRGYVPLVEFDDGSRQPKPHRGCSCERRSKSDVKRRRQSGIR
nr:hypothetical protein [Paraburkholderia madseniana]MDQ6465764.1 hypothetical protein [Paraburkholderia madseniana]